MFLVFAHGRVNVSYQRLKKWHLMPPCLTLSIIRHISRVKWSNPAKGLAPSPTLRSSSYYLYYYVRFFINENPLLEPRRQIQFRVIPRTLVGRGGLTSLQRISKRILQPQHTGDLDGNFAKILHAILNKYWKQHPTNSSCTVICILP